MQVAIPPKLLSSNTHERRLSGVERVIYWVFCFSFALDFRGDESGSLVLYFFLSVFLGSSALYLMVTMNRTASRTEKQSRGLVWINRLWWFYLASTAFTVIVMSVDPLHYMKVGVSYVVCGLSISMAKRMVSRNIRLIDMVTPLVYATIVSTAWTAFYSVMVKGVSVDESRYQITSPAIPLLFAYGMWLLIVGRRPKLLELLGIVLSVVLTVLSITRSNLVVLAGLVLAYVLLRRGATNKGGRRSVVMVIVAGLVGCMGLLLATYLRPDTLETWQARIFEQRTAENVDVTALTRIAEFSGQWKSLTEGLGSLAIGRGLGSTYVWDKDITDHFGPEATREEYSVWDGGHSFWVYSIYTGGFLFGPIVPAVYLLSMAAAWRRARAAMRLQAIWQKNPSLQLQILPFLVLVAYFGFTFTAHPIATRFSALTVGIFFGLSWKRLTLARGNFPHTSSQTGRGAVVKPDVTIKGAATPRLG
jgi:hypothetical protein